jgi:hypothetical protein
MGTDAGVVRPENSHGTCQNGEHMTKFSSFLLGTVLSVSPLLPVDPSYAADECGLVNKQNRELAEERRFELLAEYGGRAFIDMRTCLVWQLDVNDSSPKTLDDAMRECASLGQGGPHGEMGWQLPSLSELTSVDSADWTKQRSEFEQYKIPALNRSEIDFWTSTPWLGRRDSWSVVQFSTLTTIPHPVTLDSKAAVWCVRGHSARGLR